MMPKTDKTAHRKAALRYARSEKNKTVNRRRCKKYSRSDKGKAAYKRRLEIIKSYLQDMFWRIENQCNNPEHRGYAFFGRRKIKNEFKSFGSFYRHIVVDLGIIDVKQIKGLDASRINKLGHFAKGNIQFITRQQHGMGTQKRRTYREKVCSSRFKGVYWSKEKKWYCAKIYVDGKQVFVGYFSDEEAAAGAYDEAAKKYFDQYALTNKMMGLL